MMKKRFIAILLTVVLCASLMPAIPAQAVKYGDSSGIPADHWPIKQAFDKADEAGDTAGITKHGEELINYWLKGRSASQCAALWLADIHNFGWEINAVYNTSRLVGLTYEANNDFRNAARFMRMQLDMLDAYVGLITNGIRTGNADDFIFTAMALRNKLKAYDGGLVLYAEIEKSFGNGDRSFRNAKHEPEYGIYYGMSPDQSGAKQVAKKNSSMIVYIDYEYDDLEARVENDLRFTENNYGYNRNDFSVLHVAWNFLGEGSTVKTIPNDTAKITKAATYLQSLGIPILLRVGAEMNVWENRADPAEYIAAYRFIANIMRQNAPNVAMVWSLNDISHFDVSNDDFYPGEQYVDWVGISLYMRRYGAQGNVNLTHTNAAIYGLNMFANPVERIRDIVETYGGRHPIMISECAVSLMLVSGNTDLTDWALPIIRRLYGDIPMVYPQVKAIHWFNPPHLGSAYRFNLGFSPAAADLKSELTNSGYFLGQGQKEPTITYARIGNSAVTMPANRVVLQTYSPYVAHGTVTIQYQLDGTTIGSSEAVPYRRSIDLTDRADGSYRLTVRAVQGGTVIETVGYNLLKHRGNVLISTGNIETPVTPPGPLDDADGWAQRLLEPGMASGLLLEKMFGKWKQTTNRLLAAEAITKLIEDISGKSIDSIATEKGFDMTDRFSDTSDKNATFLKAAGISTGMDGVNYGINENFNRIQMVVMLGRMAEIIFDTDLSGYTTNQFTDLPNWVVTSGQDRFVNWAAATGITEGVGGGLFAPLNNLVNQETGIFALRAFNHLSK